MKKSRTPITTPKQSAETTSEMPDRSQLIAYALGGALLLAAIIWSYWPTLAAMVSEWDRLPDYSHGYLVVPIAALFLWVKRKNLRLDALSPNFWGLGLILLAGLMRLGAGFYYLKSIDGWSLPIMLAGGVLLLYGTHCLRWCWPSLVFLFFMIPIPYSAERWLSLPLQSIATKLSTACLVALGQPAISEGHTILLGDHHLGVEEACSGLRIFVGIFALAFVFVLFFNWSWWQKALLLAAALPVAIIANMVRIVTTALLYQWVSGDAAKRFSHDISGFVMIPFAAVLLFLFLVYLEKLFPEVEDVAPGAVSAV